MRGVLDPLQIAVFPEILIGAEFPSAISIGKVVVLVPQLLVVVSSMTTGPLVPKVTVGEELFDVAGVPPGNDQLKLSASVELLPSKDTDVGQETVLSANSIDATGGLFTLIVIVAELLQLPTVPVME